MYHATQGFPVIKQICKYFQFQLTHYLRADWEPGESPKPWLEGAPFWEAFSNVHCYFIKDEANHKTSFGKTRILKTHFCWSPGFLEWTWWVNIFKSFKSILLHSFFWRYIYKSCNNKKICIRNFYKISRKLVGVNFVVCYNS